MLMAGLRSTLEKPRLNPIMWIGRGRKEERRERERRKTNFYFLSFLLPFSFFPYFQKRKSVAKGSLSIFFSYNDMDESCRAKNHIPKVVAILAFHKDAKGRRRRSTLKILERPLSSQLAVCLVLNAPTLSGCTTPRPLPRA